MGHHGHLSQQRLDRVRRMRPAAVDEFMSKHGERPVLIYSREHHAFWKAGGAGYSVTRMGAHTYALRNAWELTRHCGPEKEIHYELI